MSAQDDQVTIDDASRVVGVSPRTLRKWIVHGKLPAYGGQHGKLVRLADVVSLAQTENGALASPKAAEGEDTVIETALPRSPAIEGILEELRDGVLWPLAERVELLARENGRLVAERDAAIARAEADVAFVERLVQLLQEQLAAAHRRIAELEAQLNNAKTTPEPPPAPVTPRGIGRHRLGQRPSSGQLPMPPELSILPPIESQETETPQPSQRRGWSFWRRRSRRKRRGRR